MDRSIVEKKHILSSLFIILIIGISIGYAALKTDLTINGTTKISKVEWNIKFNNVSVTEDSVTGSATIDPEDPTKLTYTATLQEPGDFYEFTVDIENNGTLSAKVQSTEVDELTSAEDLYANYTITNLPITDEVLAAKGKKTITVKIEYDPDVNPQDLPTEEKTIQKTIKINYVQDK